jgi:hypothetical protein
VYKLQGLFVRYRLSNRDGRYSNEPNSHQQVATLNIGYVYLGEQDFGAVDWQEGTAQ